MVKNEVITALSRVGFYLRHLFCFALFIVAISPALAFTQEFKIYTERFPPYNYTAKGEITGISTEIVREILRRVGHEDNIEVSSWSRAYNRVQKEDNIILYSTTRSPIREELFKWVGPLVPNNTVFFARKVSNVSIRSMDDARKVGRIGVYLDDFGELLLKKKGFTNLRSVPDNRVNVRDLAAGKIDLWIINDLTGKHMAGEAGLGDKIEKVFDVQKDFMYMAFSKNTPDAVIEKWQKILDEIKSDGTYAQIFSNWIMFSNKKDNIQTSQVNLTDEQRHWLAKHPIIKMATDPDYPPFQFTGSGGTSRGIANDYLTLMGEKLGIAFEPVLTKSWSQSQELVKSREADLLAVAAPTEERKKYLLFTSSYVQFPDVIITRKNSPTISSFEQLNGKSIASIPGFAINDYLKENYPSIAIIEKPDTQSLLRSISTGEVDVATLNLATTSYQIEKTRITNLRISAQTDFSYKLAFASRKDWPLLNQILEKALASLTYEERTEIDRRWVSLDSGLDAKSKPQLAQLTEEERTWLAQHPVIAFAPDPFWPPIEFFDDIGAYSGMTADYIALLEEKLGVTFKEKRLKNWESVLTSAKNRKIDMTTAAASTKSRGDYMLFTKPYMRLPSVIIVDKKVKGALTMEELKGKKVSVVSGFASHEYMKENYPQIILDPVFNVLEGLRKVSFGKSYALVANVATSAYLMEREVMPNLRIAGESGFTFNLAMASRKDWPMLNRILDKGLDAISMEERQEIFRKWISISEKPWITVRQILIGLSIILGIVFVVGIVVWNRQLSVKVGLKTRELRASEENFRNLYKTALVGLYRASLDGTRVFAANPALAKLFGYDSDEHFIEKFIPLDSYVDPAQMDDLIERLEKDGEVEEFEYVGRRLDGSIRNFILNAFVYKDKGYLEGAVLDITERKKNEEVIRKLAMTDPLTGLANRNQFNAKLDSAIAYSKRFDQLVGLVLIDLDDFKPVNDTHGHPVGDKLLQHVATELNRTFRDVDTTARIGGDEFAVVLNGVKSKEDALRLTEKMLKLLSTPVELDNCAVQIGASMGLCFFPGDGIDMADMLKKGDQALYKAKAQGKNQICMHKGGAKREDA